MMTTTAPVAATAQAWRVVVVDDSLDDRAEVRRLLLRGSDRRYKLIEAETGAAAIRAVLDATAGPPDCVVLDYNLPDMDAVEVLAALAGPDGMPACPVVVLTGSVGHEHTRAVLRAGAQDYLGKGWMTPESLTRAVENAAERWAMGRELRGTAAALRASEERFRLAVEASATGLWTWDVRTDAVTWSPECYPIHGVSEGQFEGTGAAFFRLVHPDDQGRVEATVRAAVADRALYECEFRVVRPRGEVAWVQNRGRASYDDRGQPLAVLGTITDISMRKRAEADLARSEAFAHSVIEASADCVKGLTPDGRLLWMNGPGRRMLHGNESTPNDQNWPALWEPFGLRAEAEAAVAVAREGGVGRFRGFRPTADGAPHWWDVAVTPVPNPEGGVEQLLVVCRDITAAQVSEDRLRARERELQTLADNTPDILSRFDRGLRHVFVNRAVERVTGRACEEFLGKTNRELGMPAEQCDQWDAALRYVFEHRWHRSIEFVFHAHDGPRHFVSRMVPEFGPGGDVEAVLAVAHDVTDLKRVEAAARADAERLELALNAARAGAWAWEVPTGAITWSPENYALYGLDPAAGPPRYEDWVARVHPDDRDRVSAAVQDAVSGRSPEFRSEFRVLHPTLGHRWLLGLGRVEFGPDGQPVRMVGINLDITESKQIVQTLADQDRRKDEFLATLAHELRNPLAPIRNGLAVLRLGHQTERAEKTLGMMDRQLGHMVNLVDDLLDVSRVRSGKITLRDERVTVREAVDAAVEACRPTVDAKGHSLTLDLPTEPLAVKGDRTRLVQVVANLLTNAAKYSESGGRIRVAAAREGGEAVVRVSDTGVGIAPDLLPTLWDMFTQVRDTLDKAQGGLGIGLSLVKKLVEMHGGTVTAESAGLGKGSTFTVRLPLVQDAPALLPVTPPPPRPGADAARPAGRRVLVVDDNEDGADSLATILELSGHVAATAFNGFDAIKKVAEFRPEIVFLDIGLPGIDGYEVARRLRAEPDTARTVLVALTGWGSEDDKQKSRDAGFDFHLTKPVLADAVAAVFARFPRA